MNYPVREGHTTSTSHEKVLSLTKRPRMGLVTFLALPKFTIHTKGLDTFSRYNWKFKSYDGAIIELQATSD
jgi:hypothetical protein